MARRLPPVLDRTVGRGWRTLSGSGDNELVPQARLSGPMPWVIAIMVALTVIAAAGGLALRNTASAAAADLANGVTVQIIEANPELRQRGAERAAARLRATPGVTSVRVVPQDQVELMIEPWLGAQTIGDEGIPVPALVDARLREAVDGEMLGALRRSVREVAPAARIDAQASWLKPVFAALDSLKWLSLALVAVLAAAMAAAVILAVRTALGTNRDTIEIVHLLGGTDQQIARVFQRSAGFDAAGGGAVGLALGLGVILLLGQQFAALGAGLFTGSTLAWYDWLAIALIPVAGVALAVLTTRFTVLRALRRML